MHLAGIQSHKSTTVTGYLESELVARRQTFGCACWRVPRTLGRLPHEVGIVARNAWDEIPIGPLFGWLSGRLLLLQRLNENVPVLYLSNQAAQPRDAHQLKLSTCIAESS